MNHFYSQTLKLLVISFKSIKFRIRRSLATLIGSLSVTLVLLTLLAIAHGYGNVLKVTASSNHAMVLMQGTNAELSSVLDLDSQTLIRQHQWVSKASPEGFSTVKLFHRNRDSSMNVSLRGVTKSGFTLRPQLTITQGRMFNNGVNELIVGRRIAEQYEGMNVGSTYRLGGHQWQVVGIFDANGSLNESEIWTNLASFQTMMNKGSNAQVIYLDLQPNVTHTQFSDAINNDPRINVRVTTEQKYLSEQTESMNKFVETLGYGISVLMMAAAIFASFNNNTSNIQLRTKELATLKSLGFRNSSISMSLIIESLLWSFLGGVLGVLICYLAFEGYSTSTLFFSHNYSQVAFTFSISLTSVFLAFLITFTIGLLGSLYPVKQFLNRPIVRALASRY